MNTFTIKPLVWERCYGSRFVARSGLSIYEVWLSARGNWMLGDQANPSLKAAKAAAQKHHERQLMKWLEPVTRDLGHV